MPLATEPARCIVSTKAVSGINKVSNVQKAEGKLQYLNELLFIVFFLNT